MICIAKVKVKGMGICAKHLWSEGNGDVMGVALRCVKRIVVECQCTQHTNISSNNNQRLVSNLCFVYHRCLTRSLPLSLFHSLCPLHIKCYISLSRFFSPVIVCC